MKRNIGTLFEIVAMLLLCWPILLVSFLIEWWDPKGFWGR